MSDDLRERVARAACDAVNGDGAYDETGTLHREKVWHPAADAAIALVRAEVLEEAARVAEGPAYRTSGNGEISIRGTDKGNWSVPMPISGFKGSDYGTGRYDAAAAIRALKEKK